MPTRPGLIVIASDGFRRDPAGPFLPLIRDYAPTLRRFQLHSTRGSAVSMLSTGEFTSDDSSLPNCNQADPHIKVYRYGREGGVVEIAALIPLERCEAVMFFLDPSDTYSEIPENRALQRVCKELGVRLISTIETARQWLEFESPAVLDPNRRAHAGTPRIPRWTPGNPNVDALSGALIPLRVEEQTVALIAHDRRKEDLVLFVNHHSDFLQQYHRILTTGTTGFTLKLLFGTRDQVASVMENAPRNLGRERFAKLIDGAVKLLLQYSLQLQAAEEQACLWLGGKELPSHLQDWLDSDRPRATDSPEPMLLQIGDIRENLHKFGLLRPRRRLVGRIQPAPSGPKGGDIILANEVLTHKCHAAIFFQDPQSAHAHDPDIRLFERTCHFWSPREPRHRVYITCVSESRSAHKWASAMAEVPVGGAYQSSVPERLRRRPEWGLRDIVLIDKFLKGKTRPKLGEALVEAGARYFFTELRLRSRDEGPLTIGIGHGETIYNLVQQLERLRKQLPFPIVSGELRKIVCIPLVGNVSQYELKRQATAIARELAERLKGESKAFEAPGLILRRDSTRLSKIDRELMGDLANADLILVAGGVYGPTEMDSHPVGKKIGSRTPVGIMSSIVLDQFGDPMEDVMKTVGIGFDGLKKAAKRGRVIFLCAGEDRRGLLLSAVRAGLVSVLVTDNETARWLSEQKG